MNSCKSWHRLVHWFCSSEHDPAPKLQCPFDCRPLLAFSSGFEEEVQSADQNQIPILISPPFPSPLSHGSVSQQDGQHYLTAIFTAGHCTLLESQKSRVHGFRWSKKKCVVSHFLGKCSELQATSQKQMLSAFLRKNTVAELGSNLSAATVRLPCVRNMTSIWWCLVGAP